MPPLLLRKPKEARDVHRRARLSYSHQYVTNTTAPESVIRLTPRDRRQPRQQHSVGERDEKGNDDAAACRRRRQTSGMRRQPSAADTPSPPNTSEALTIAKKPRVGAVGPAYALSPMTHSSGAEAYFFYHFREWTCDGLADSSPGSADFWKHYVLPLATQDGLVRTTLAAVGAAHQLFVARSAPQTLAATPWSRKTDEMERATYQQYNTAISAMVARMSAAEPDGAEAGPSVETHIVLLCCVLFICFESMMGRYAESIKHFEAGARMLLGPASLQGIRDPATGHHLADMFAHLGVEFSAFLDDEQLVPPVLGAPESYFGGDQAHRAFANLTEAATALRAFDLAYIRGGFSSASVIGNPAHETTTAVAVAAAAATAHVWQTHTLPPPPLPQQQQHQCLTLAGLPSPETTPLGTPTGEHPMAALFEKWEMRFEKTLAAGAGCPRSAFEERQLGRLRLQQRLWPVIFALDLTQFQGGLMHYVPDPAVDAAWWRFLERAEEAAAPLVRQYAASARPTFSLDGDLVSALSLLVTTAAEPALEQRGLALLRALHRREGVWDSAEIVELHEAALALGDALDDACPPEGGIPALAKALVALSTTKRFSPTNGLLRVPDHPAPSTPPPMAPEGKLGNRWNL